jgi:hypothetical protein
MNIACLLLALVKSLAGYAAQTALGRKTTLQGYCFAAIRAILQAYTSGHTPAHRCNRVVIQM